MYKYIIYCSISAVIIIAAKYVYQNWIKQNHTIATIKQDIQLLQTKVKNVEEHFEKTKGSLSGGVTIPIVFQKLNKSVPVPAPTPVQAPPKPQSPVKVKNNIQLNNNLDSNVDDLSSTISSMSTISSEISSNASSKNKTTNTIILSSNIENDKKSVSSISSQTKSSKSSSKKKILDFSEEKVKDITEVPLDHPVEEVPLEVVEPEVPKKTKKKSLPDAKDYNNGDKFKDETGVEYLCVVGKRGGHSWQKINANI